MVDLVSSLRQSLGREYVITDRVILSLYERNPPGVRGQATCVAFPETVEEVSEIVQTCYERQARIYPQGGTTELSGSSTPEKDEDTEAVVVNFKRMDKIEEITPIDGYVTVQAGAKIANLTKELSQHGYMYPVEPASDKSATVGGVINTGSGGLMGVKYGTTRDWVLSLEVVVPDESGTILQLGNNTLKWRTGYDLPRLITGSEGTLALVTKATLKIIPEPENKVVVAAFYDTLEEAVKAVAEVKRNKILPYMIELVDADTVRRGKEVMNIDTEGEGNMVIVGEECSSEGAKDRVTRLVNILKNVGGKNIDYALSYQEALDKGLLALRKALYPLGIFLGVEKLDSPTGAAHMWDLVVPVSKLPEVVKVVKGKADEYGFSVLLAGHAGDGNLHPTLFIDYANEEEWKKAHSFSNEVMKKVAELGGSVSGEHGIGTLKKEGMEAEVKVKSSEKSLYFMSKVKDAWDPRGLLNPDKVFSQERSQ